MKKSVEILNEAISRFDIVNNVIEAIINVQVSLKNVSMVVLLSARCVLVK